MSAPRLEPLPAGIVNLGDFEPHAQARMTASAFAYLNGGAADELSPRANRSAWEAIRLHPRVLRPLGGGHMRRSLFGRELPQPILLAPIAYQRLAHPDGELASAHAAAAQGAGMVLSTQSSVAVEEVALAMRDAAGPLWFQLYVQADRGLTRELVQRAQQAGCQALVLTVDAPVHGARDRERRAGFQLPGDVRAVHLPLATRDQHNAGTSLFDGLMHHAASWDDLDWLRDCTSLPILLKGVAHAEDARLALDRGVDGLVVSNHGGRTLDGVPATAELLPYLVEAVRAHRQSHVPVLVDGGLRRGTDVLKALCLGADAVLLGRPYVHALATAGALGVAHALRLLRDEFEIAMALCGCKHLDDAGPELLWNRPK